MTVDENAGLGRSAARGAGVTALGQLVRILLQATSIVVLARLLLPSDYGVIAIVMSVVAFAEVLRDFGLSQAAIQATRLTPAQRSNLFWVNSAIGASLGLLLVALAPLIAALYKKPELVIVLQIMALYFVLNGFATQYRADLNRRMKFVGLAVTEVASSAIALAVAIVLAALGAGYWALVAQQLSYVAVGLILLVAQGRWIPRWYDRSSSIRPLMAYGMNLLGAQLLDALAKNVYTFAIGIRFGVSQLGLYDRALQLVMLPLNQINAPSTKVAVPVLSRLKEDRVRFASFLLSGQTVLIHIVCAVFALGAALAGPVLEIVLGSGWDGAVTIFRILVIGGVAQVLGYASYWAFLSLGDTRSFLRLTLISRPTLAIAVVVGAFWGPVGAAIAYSSALMVLWPFALWWLRNADAVPVKDMFLNGLRVLAGYLLCAASAYITDSWFSDQGNIVRILVGTAAFMITFAVIVALWPAFRRDVTLILEMRRFLSRRRA